MKMIKIKQKAKLVGLSPGKLKKTDLVRAIQDKEGNYSCYQTSQASCDQTECCWRTDCLSC